MNPEQASYPRPHFDQVMGHILRNLRDQHGFTQEELAAAIGMQEASLALIERGACSPYLRTFMQMAIRLNILPSHIFELLETLLGDDWRRVCTTRCNRK